MKNTREDTVRTDRQDGEFQPKRPTNIRDMLSVFITWVYHNVCGYGIQIQRTSHRIYRKTKKLLRPAGAALAGLWQRIYQPLTEGFKTMCKIGSDSAAVLRSAGRTAKKDGFRAAAAQTARSAVSGASKNKSFLISAVNHCLPVVCIVAMLLTATAVFSRNYVLAVECDGELVGYVSDETTYNQATELVSERVINANDGFRSALSPRYSLVPVTDESQLNSSQEICNNILLNSDDVEEAYGFFVNGKLIAAVRSQGDITFMLDSFLEKYRRGDANETISFVGSTEVVYGLYSREKIVSSGEFNSAISAQQMDSQLYTVRSGDSLESILSAYSMTEDRFLELNVDFTGELLKGDTVVIEKEQPVLRVQNIVVKSEEKTIAYTTVTEKDDSKYTTYSNVKQEGQNGTQLVTKQLTYVDGELISSTVISTETLKEPVNKIIVVGTKKTTVNHGNYGTAQPNPNVSGSGRFTWPVPGVTSISSPFGWRWGRQHSGIDISCSGIYGRTIVAADAGTVTTVKNSPSGYGLHVIINHGNGYTTLYGHCSAVLVTAGQTVSKGQAIAKVGSSGRSTGPHLHFEIRVNGTAKNPMNWF